MSDAVVSVSVGVVWGELIDQLCHAHAALDRGIVLEGELRGPLQPELTRQPGLEHAVGRLQPGEARLALARGAEDADEDPSLAEIGRGLDAGHRDEPDPWVLEVGQGLGEHLTHRLVHSAHASRHARNLSALLVVVVWARTRLSSQSASRLVVFGVDEPALDE